MIKIFSAFIASSCCIGCGIFAILDPKRFIRFFWMTYWLEKQLFGEEGTIKLTKYIVGPICIIAGIIIFFIIIFQ